MVLLHDPVCTILGKIVPIYNLYVVASANICWPFVMALQYHDGTKSCESLVRAHEEITHGYWLGLKTVQFLRTLVFGKQHNIVCRKYFQNYLSIEEGKIKNGWEWFCTFSKHFSFHESDSLLLLHHNVCSVRLQVP